MSGCCGGGNSGTIGSSGDKIRDQVKEYYGKTLQSNKDLKTDVCTTNFHTMPKHVRLALKEISEEVTSKYYGCGLVIPDDLEGMNVLDLGSGSGQDCFVLSKLVGAEGSVTGVDMTDEQLEVANRNITYHTEKFGYSKPNVTFVKGDIGKLGEAGLQDNSFDIIVSNCVVNLVPDKKSVLQEAYRVLKDGGELYFSDLYADRDVPQSIKENEVLWGECIAGALWWEDLIRFAQEIGFHEPCLLQAKYFNVYKEEYKQILGETKFLSAEYRLFKLPAKKEEASLATYMGDILGAEKEFTLDHQWTFKSGEQVAIPGNVVAILKYTRFNKHFTFQPCTSESVIISQKMEKNPFLLVKENESQTSKSCCAPSKDQSTDKQACCAPSKDQSTDKQACCTPNKDKQACC